MRLSKTFFLRSKDVTVHKICSEGIKSFPTHTKKHHRLPESPNKGSFSTGPANLHILHAMHMLQDRQVSASDKSLSSLLKNCNGAEQSLLVQQKGGCVWCAAQLRGLGGAQWELELAGSSGLQPVLLLLPSLSPFQGQGSVTWAALWLGVRRQDYYFLWLDRVNPPQRQIWALVTETDELHPFMERKTILQSCNWIVSN